MSDSCQRRVGGIAYNYGMVIDADVCYRALQSRDRRFDGHFFTGVRTTGVYCRPVCPARTPLRRNVTFYPSAAAAEAAGFRPCRKCMPEHSPGTPAWSPVPEAVSRALHLIAEGALDEDGVDRLARRVGLGDRQLRRLFDQHLGAGPIAIAKARRIHFAKRLLDETSLPVTDIAFASGFRSIRQFNHDFRATFHRTPSEVRRSRADSNGPLVVRLAYRPPLDFERLLSFFAVRAIPGVESVSDGAYRRVVHAGDAHGAIEARAVDGKPYLRLAITVPTTANLLGIVSKARRLFDLDADPAAIADALHGDPILRAESNPGLRVPGAWDGFEVAVRAVLGQQISVAAATTLSGRLVEMFGKPLDGDLGPGLTHAFPSPETLAGAPIEQIGLRGGAASAIRSVAAAVADGSLTFDAGLGLDAIVRGLVALPGVGEWTAHYVAMRACGEPDAFPAADLGLRKAAGMTTPQLRAAAEAWRPWRAYAAQHLWSSLNGRSGG